MIIKKLILTFFFVILIIPLAVAQQGLTISSREFKNLIGCWQGTLKYAGTMIRKPYTTTTGLVVKQTGTSNKFEFVNVYTKDPNENTFDTITISKDGRKINGAIIKSKRYSGGELKLTAEGTGIDDNNKVAILRYTYTIGKSSYSYKKDIKQEGQSGWVETQESRYVRSNCR